MIVALPLGAAVQNPAYRPSDPTFQARMVNEGAVRMRRAAPVFLAVICLFLTKNCFEPPKMSVSVIVSQFIPC
jgi:hypothetical protein